MQTCDMEALSVYPKCHNIITMPVLWTWNIQCHFSIRILVNKPLWRWMSMPTHCSWVRSMIALWSGSIGSAIHTLQWLPCVIKCIPDIYMETRDELAINATAWTVKDNAKKRQSLSALTDDLINISKTDKGYDFYSLINSVCVCVRVCVCFTTVLDIITCTSSVCTFVHCAMTNLHTGGAARVWAPSMKVGDGKLNKNLSMRWMPLPQTSLYCC